MNRAPGGGAEANGAQPLPAGGADSVAAGVIVHASAVATSSAHGERGVLILGPSGSGKTRLALELIALGHALDIALIGDDRVQIEQPEMPGAGPPRMRAVPTIAGLVEIRGHGVLRHPYRQAAPIWLAVDLTPLPVATHEQRLFPMRALSIASASVPCLGGGAGLHAASIIAMLRTGRLPDAEQGPVAVRVASTIAVPSE
ncbi:MAG: hypothetical protein AAF577_07600 [Pseudomonadota bacterium]